MKMIGVESTKKWTDINQTMIIIMHTLSDHYDIAFHNGNETHTQKTFRDISDRSLRDHING